MRRVLVLLCCCPFVLAAAGYRGPLRDPMPTRLEDEEQKKVDEAWDRALTPVTRFDHQGLLDCLIGTRAYQTGVDKLTFRSEKKFSGGTVVMEVHYDRLAPEKDRFEVTILDPKGKQVRRERYDRAKVEQTNRDLFNYDQLNRKKEEGKASPDELKELSRLEARWAAIERIFPKPEDKPGRPKQPREEGKKR